MRDAKDHKEILESLISNNGDCSISNNTVLFFCKNCPVYRLCDISHTLYASKEHINLVYDFSIEKYVELYGKAALMEILL